MESSLHNNDSNFTKSRNLTSVQLITAIIVGCVLLSLVALNIVIYMIYKKAVKSYKKTIEKRENMAARLEQHMRQARHRHGNNLDGSATSTSVSRANSCCSEADTLPKKDQLNNSLIENQTPRDTLEIRRHVKNKSILKTPNKNVDGCYHYDDRVSNRRCSDFGKITPSDCDDISTSSSFSNIIHGLPPSTLQSVESRSLSVENVKNLNKDADLRSIKLGSTDSLHSTPVKRVSLVASEKQIHEISTVKKLMKKKAPPMPLGIRSKMGEMMLHHRQEPKRHKNSKRSILASSVTTVRPGLSTHDINKFKRPYNPNQMILHHHHHHHKNGHEETRNDTSRRVNTHEPKVLVTDLKRISSNGDNLTNITDGQIHINELKHIDSKGSNISNISVTYNSTSGTDFMDRHANTHRCATPVKISDFKHVDLEDELKRECSNVSHLNNKADSPLSIRVNRDTLQQSMSDRSKGANSFSLRSVTCSSSTTKIVSDSPKGGKRKLEANTSTDTINSAEVAMLASKVDNYGDIEIVDNSSKSRLKHPHSPNDDLPVVEFQNLAFDNSEIKTELGTFYIGDIEL